MATGRVRTSLEEATQMLERAEAEVALLSEENQALDLRVKRQREIGVRKSEPLSKYTSVL
ncbi:MAG: hypothetical protein SGPRY_003807 [Prymnesium sp.]